MSSTENRGDFNITSFADILGTLDAVPPVTSEYEDWDIFTKQPGKHLDWYRDQKTHMVLWFSTQGRLSSDRSWREKPNCSARTAYNRLQTATGILWIAEALGGDHEIVQIAAKDARAAPLRSRAAAARKILPWHRIAKLAGKQLLNQQ